ncbi:hypothetical protein QYZ44_21575 [Vibrio parahaemolyticus]|nr:hypothetical protein [Vibrio parahaemolyticus]MDN4711624.1 hypothetical protein [Vibrio parahaemolyticus]
MRKVNPKQAATIAEVVIVDYVESTGCQTSDDVAKVLELLISKSARAIEKAVNNQKSVEVCFRTICNIQNHPMQVVKH